MNRDSLRVVSCAGHFDPESSFSAADLAAELAAPGEADARIAAIVREAHQNAKDKGDESPRRAFVASRILHSLGTALSCWQKNPSSCIGIALPTLLASLSPSEVRWLDLLDSRPEPDLSVPVWAEQLRAAAFRELQTRIVSAVEVAAQPRNALRSDEIAWGRAPARIDLAGGWTDTPPFALECGGQVLNAAVELNDQPPIHVYARVTPEPLIRCRSIDRGTQEEIRTWDDLLQDRATQGDFTLPKAALRLSGFSPDQGSTSASKSLVDVLDAFGGGLELTTLAAVPKGSGLGTSSIMGAVLLATLHRVLGMQLAPRELFHGVLRLEQIMTTGGGWQDQVGGASDGLKLVTTRPGLIPDPSLRYIPSDALDPRHNDNQTLLYYTGITRLAKNILEEVVGAWLDRDRNAVDTLHQIGRLAADTADAVGRRDIEAMGHFVDVAWQLNKRLDPHCTNPEIDELLDRCRRNLFGAKLLGAGGGGFLLMVARSRDDARQVRQILESRPPNPRARFFRFSVSKLGLVVSVC